MRGAEKESLPSGPRTIDRELRTIEHELSTTDVLVPKIALRVRQIGKRGGATEVPNAQVGLHNAPGVFPPLTASVRGCATR